MRSEGLTIRMSRAELLTKISEQRAKHIAEYEEALRAWRDMMYREALEVVKGHLNLTRFPKALLKLSQCPEHHTDDFDTNIAMLESAKDELIELDQETYERLVLGKFEWRESFAATNAIYGPGRLG